MSEHEWPHIDLNFEHLSESQMRSHARDFHERMKTRRSVRSFATSPLPLDVVREAIATAGTAPSGAHKQPWLFVLVTEPQIKRAIRQQAEIEERETYDHRMSEEWRTALAPLGTDAHKPFLETAPALIVMFRKDYDLLPSGKRSKNYYVQESCGIALGLLIAALHHSGIATLTHTPSPMKFLARILGRPDHEKPFMLLPIGYPAADCRVPELARKPLHEILIEL